MVVTLQSIYFLCLGTESKLVNAGVERVDGLQGALIVRPQGPDLLESLYDEERVVTLTDWYHDLYGSLTFATSRYCASPFLFNSARCRICMQEKQTHLRGLSIRCHEWTLPLPTQMCSSFV